MFVFAFLERSWKAVWNFVGPMFIKAVKGFVVDLLSAILDLVRPQAVPA